MCVGLPPSYVASDPRHPGKGVSEKSLQEGRRGGQPGQAVGVLAPVPRWLCSRGLKSIPERQTRKRALPESRARGAGKNVRTQAAWLTSDERQADPAHLLTPEH